jgi:hypothetical protein
VCGLAPRYLMELVEALGEIERSDHELDYRRHSLSVGLECSLETLLMSPGIVEVRSVPLRTSSLRICYLSILARPTATSVAAPPITMRRVTCSWSMRTPAITLTIGIRYSCTESVETVPLPTSV